MKHFFVVALSLVFIVSCKKNNNDMTTDPDPVITPIPPIVSGDPVHTSIFLRDIGTNTSLNINFAYGVNYFQSFPWQLYYLNNISADKYVSQLNAFYPPDYNSIGEELYKIFPVGDAITNYVNYKHIDPVNSGNLPLDISSGTFTLPGNGELVIAPFSFGTNLTASTTLLTAYTNPELTEYAVYLPCYAMAEYNQQKKFLQSYGVFYLQLWNASNLGFHEQIDPNGNVKLRLPILADMQAGAPDSIPAWNIDSLTHLWVQNGFAHKSGNFYEKNIYKKGYWNFAVPQNGTFINIKLRTDSATTVTNTELIIKDPSAKEIAEGYTDANGNATLFVPTNQNLSLVIKPIIAVSTQTTNIGSFSSTVDVPVTVSVTSGGFATVFGKVYDCNGTPIAGGYLSFEGNNSTSSKYHLPFSNGYFATSLWSDYTIFTNYKVKIYDNQDNQVGDSTLLNLYGGNYNGGATGKQYNLNFYSCANSTKLWLNYAIDGVKYSLIDDATSPSCFLLETTPGVNYTGIQTHHNGLGVDFNFSPGSINYDINANGVSYTDDNTSGLGYHYFTRDDGNTGGIVEGAFSLYCRDAANAMHNITGNYRLKRN